MVDKKTSPNDPDQGPPEYDGTALPKAGSEYAPRGYPTPDLSLFCAPRYLKLERTRSYTSITIQSALDSLGEHATLYLPQKTSWAVSSPIVLRPYQELATWGYPATESDMATLKAESTCKPHMIKGDGARGIRIRNLKINGRRETFGYDGACYNLVLLGGKGGLSQVMDRCIIVHPRGEGCPEVIEGGDGVRITNNVIGPAGIDPDSEPGERRARGISYWSNNGLVAGNQIIDVTDIAIVLYSSPGTLITSNTIITRHRTCATGIDMDVRDSPENYELTRVTHNTISIQGSYLRIGIGQGYGVTGMLSSQNKKFTGGYVFRNLIESIPVDPENPGGVGFGFAVSGVDNWKCIDNVSKPDVVYRGSWPDLQLSPGETLDAPAPFILSKDLNSSDVSDTAARQNQFQPEFNTRPSKGKAIGLLRIRP